MSVDQNKAFLRRGYEALNQRNWAVFDELCISEFVFHNASILDAIMNAVVFVFC